MHNGYVSYQTRPNLYWRGCTGSHLRPAHNEVVVQRYRVCPSHHNNGICLHTLVPHYPSVKGTSHRHNNYISFQHHSPGNHQGMISQHPKTNSHELNLPSLFLTGGGLSL